MDIIFGDDDDDDVEDNDLISKPNIDNDTCFIIFWEIFYVYLIIVKNVQ